MMNNVFQFDDPRRHIVKKNSPQPPQTLDLCVRARSAPLPVKRMKEELVVIPPSSALDLPMATVFNNKFPYTTTLPTTSSTVKISRDVPNESTHNNTTGFPDSPSTSEEANHYKLFQHEVVKFKTLKKKHMIYYNSPVSSTTALSLTIPKKNSETLKMYREEFNQQPLFSKDSLLKAKQQLFQRESLMNSNNSNCNNNCRQPKIKENRCRRRRQDVGPSLKDYTTEIKFTSMCKMLNIKRKVDGTHKVEGVKKTEKKLVRLNPLMNHTDEYLLINRGKVAELVRDEKQKVAGGLLPKPLELPAPWIIERAGSRADVWCSKRFFFK